MDMKTFTMPTEKQLHDFFDFVNRAYDGTHKEQVWINLLKSGRRLSFGQQKLMDLFDLTRDQAVKLIVEGIECEVLQREGTQVVIPFQKTKMLLAMIQTPVAQSSTLSKDEQDQLDEVGEEIE